LVDRPAVVISNANTGAMPTDKGLRLDDLQPIEDFRNQTIEPDEHRAIDVADGHPPR
jgi:hypothetical protein